MTRGILHHSFIAAVVGALWVVGFVLVAFTLIGLGGSIMERLDEFRDEAGIKIPPAKTLLKMWAKGLISWDPPHYGKTPFLMVWALIFIVVMIVLPYAERWPHPAQFCAILFFVVATGIINASFHPQKD